MAWPAILPSHSAPLVYRPDVILRASALAVCCGVATVGVAQPSDRRARPASPQPATPAIQALVDELQSDRSVIRNRATRRLLQSESRASIPRLVAATKSLDVETTSRVVVILREFSLSTDEVLATAAHTGLKQVSQRRRVGLLARHELQRYSQNIRDRLIAAIANAGGTMTVEPSGHAHISLNGNWVGGPHELKRIQRFTPIRRLSLERSAITDEQLALLRGMDVERLYLGETQLTHRGLSALGRMPSLRYLSLRRVRLQGIPSDLFQNFPNLETLGLDEADVADADIASLTSLQRLQTLILDGAAIGDGAVRHLKDLPQLATLHLKQTRVTGTGFREATFPLRKLMLKECPLTNQGLAAISQLSGLRELGLDHTAVGDPQLARLGKLKSLKTLWLSKTDVTDAGLQSLRNCASLATVYVHGAPVTSAGRRQLHESLPNCRIEGVQTTR